MAESGDPKRVKVIDRRRFTPDGEVREPDAAGAGQAGTAPETPRPEPPRDAGAAAEASVPEVVDALPPKPAIESPAAEPGPLPPGAGIADIVDVLAQQAMAFLSGQVPGRGRDPGTARYFIDLLGVLKEKTSGRLTLEETNFLDDVLYQLRSLYVAATR